jgi:N-acetylmannosamine-6-phosphate 2-epimerase / N-acetylmannosamine kinase
MTQISAVIHQLKGKLVVSCQASPGDPLEDTETIRRIARAAVGGGAAGLRINGAQHIAAIRRDTNVPIIGIKKTYIHGQLRITPDFNSAAELASAGADFIALDCTNRAWIAGDPWRLCIERIHRELRLPVMADVATVQEALDAAIYGADIIGTTLNGYTEETKANRDFNWRLLADLVQQIDRPIIAEGHISTPEQARRAIRSGAWSVVVGSAITRPGAITTRFVESIEGRRITAASAMGVDIGGTFVKAGVVDREGKVSSVVRVPTKAHDGRDGIAAAVAQAIETVLAASPQQGVPLAGLGIASAGAIDARNGTVFAATENLPGWAGFNLRGFAEDRFHLPTYVDNDAHAAALAELYFGLGRQLSDFIALTIGTGVGGGIVLGGKLLSGQHGFAGTIGHHVIRVGGRLCNCGRRGCLEAYVSASALVCEYASLLGKGGGPFDVHSSRQAPGRDSELALKVSQLVSAGDAIALQAYAVLAGYLAEGIANLFNMLDPEAVILSGGLVAGHPHFASEVEKKTTELLHFGSQRRPRVQLATVTEYAGLQGAAAAVFEGLDSATAE